MGAGRAVELAFAIHFRESWTAVRDTLALIKALPTTTNVHAVSLIEALVLFTDEHACATLKNSILGTN